MLVGKEEGTPLDHATLEGCWGSLLGSQENGVLSHEFGEPGVSLHMPPPHIAEGI